MNFSSIPYTLSPGFSLSLSLDNKQSTNKEVNKDNLPNTRSTVDVTDTHTGAPLTRRRSAARHPETRVLAAD